MPKLFSTSGEMVYTTFEILLDSDQVLLLGDAYEAEDTYLTGRLVFRNTTAIKVPAIRVSLIGDYIASFRNALNNNYKVLQSGKFHRQETVVFSEGGGSLLPGNHQWPFKFLIKGHQLETLQGMPDTSFLYKVKAVVERGAFVKDHKIYKPVRVVRTYVSTSIALNQSIAVERIWPEKVKYTYSTPSRAVVFGSRIPCELVFMPLIKGLKVGTITISLFEEQEYFMKPDANLLVPKDPYKQHLEILTDVYKVPNDIETEDVDGVEGYIFTRHLQVPRDLTACRLSIDPVLSHDSVKQPYALVKINHSLRFLIHLINSDGHISEIRAKLPISLFLTPNQRLNSGNQLLNSGAITMTNNSDIIASEFGAAPSYGQHEADESLDASSMGLATPDGYLSSRGSAANLSGTVTDEQLSANTLHNALSGLINPASSRFAAEDSTRDTVLPRVLANSVGSSPPNVNSLDHSIHSLINNEESRISPRNGYTLGSMTPSRLPSGSQTPVHIEYDTTALSRVPSYNTASRSGPPVNHSYIGLPTYNEVASGPNVPERSGPTTSESGHASPENESPTRPGETSTEAERPTRVRYARGTNE